MLQAALVAISKALELCGSNYESFSVFSDLMSSLMALYNPDCQDSLVPAIHEGEPGVRVVLD